MEKPFDWTLVQSFAAVAREGSLSAAARVLRQSQPTIGRHVKELETSLGVELFTRMPRGLKPTQAGLDLLDHARAMEEAAAKLALTAEGQSADLRGTVRLTASAVVSHFLLPGILADMRRDLPEIQIELVPSDTTENLIYREADIAIRMYRPTQLDVITRHVCDHPTALYAARSYLDRVGRPETTEEALALDLIGFDRSDLIIRIMGDMGLTVTREFFPLRCDDQAAYWQLVRAGCGLGATQCVIGDADPLVERIAPQMDLPPLPYWLAAPEALHHNPRIRRVWDYLSGALAAPRGA